MSETPLKPPFKRPLTAEELASLPDEVIDTSDIPELDADFWDNAVVMAPEDWKKKQLTIRLDPDIVDFFKKGGRGYQTRINAVLRYYVDKQHEDA